MSNFSGELKLIVVAIDKGAIDETSLQSILESDLDFKENSEEFRPDTIKKGFKNEAERVSAEIFKKHKKIKEESELVCAMVSDLFKVKGFIGNSSAYGQFSYNILETDFAFIVSIAVNM